MSLVGTTTAIILSVSTAQLPFSVYAGMPHGPGIKCKTYTAPEGDGCNTCTGEKCTDGEVQWDSGARSCTLVNCMKTPTEPYNPKEWTEKER